MGDFVVWLIATILLVTQSFVYFKEHLKVALTIDAIASSLMLGAALGLLH